MNIQTLHGSEKQMAQFFNEMVKGSEFHLRNLIICVSDQSEGVRWGTALPTSSLFSWRNDPKVGLYQGHPWDTVGHALGCCLFWSPLIHLNVLNISHTFFGSGLLWFGNQIMDKRKKGECCGLAPVWSLDTCSM